MSAWVPTCKVGLQAGRPSCLFRAFVLNSRVDRCKIELREVVLKKGYAIFKKFSFLKNDQNDRKVGPDNHEIELRF